MRKHRGHSHFDRQSETVFNFVTGCTGRNVDDARGEKNLEWGVRRRFLSKIKTNGRLQHLGFSRRPHVQLQDQIRVLVQSPRQSVGLARKHIAGDPAQKVALRHLGAHRRNHEIEARFRIAFIQAARLPRPINLHERVMHDLRIVGEKFHGPNVTRRGRRNRNHEIAIDIPSAGPKRVRFGHFDHQVRLAQLPTFAPPRQGRQLRRITLHETFSDPLLDDSDLIGAQSAFVGELTVTWFRKPRRHVPALGHFRDLLGVLLHILKIQQTERRVLARPMADRAMGKYDRRYILCECQCPRWTPDVGTGRFGIFQPEPDRRTDRDCDG